MTIYTVSKRATHSNSGTILLASDVIQFDGRMAKVFRGSAVVAEFLTTATELTAMANAGITAVSAAAPSAPGLDIPNDAFVGAQQDRIVLASGDGAIAIKEGTVMVTKGSIAAITLAAPIAGTDDGKMLRVVTTTAFAHVITSSVRGFNAKGSSGTATFGAAKGNSVSLIAYNGDWWSLATIAVTIA